MCSKESLSSSRRLMREFHDSRDFLHTAAAHTGEALAAMAVASSPHSNDLFSTTARCGVFILRRTPDGRTVWRMRVNKLAGKIVWRMCVTNSLLSRYFAFFRVPSVHSHCMPIASGIAIRSYARACHGSDSADSTRARETLIPTSGTVATASQKGQRFVISRHFIQTSGRAGLPLRTCCSTLSARTASTKLTCLCNACPNFPGGSLGRAVKMHTQDHRTTEHQMSDRIPGIPAGL